ncbi:MAG: hypothetical protein IMX05_09190 [Hydrogenibacillus schlegelii]|nr:hypothetical protein [Hydrogenibacillus schlegelii]
MSTTVVEIDAGPGTPATPIEEIVATTALIGKTASLERAVKAKIIIG